MSRAGVLGLLLSVIVGCGGSAAVDRTADAATDGRDSGADASRPDGDTSTSDVSPGDQRIDSDQVPDGPDLAEDSSSLPDGSPDASEDLVEVDMTLPPDLAPDLAPDLPPDGPDCTSTCTAADQETYCKDAKTSASCLALPGTACLVSRFPTACVGAKICERVGAVASCVCPAVVATAAVGGGCATAGARICAGNTALACTAEAASGCLLWTLAEDCGALACDTAGGTAGCPCAPAPADAVHVDPVAGGGSAGRAATGAASPPSCRFKTLTEALAATGGTRTRVVASTATLPGSFAAETFPLTIPAGITVTTAASTPDPAGYEIVFAGTSAATAEAAVILNAGASLVGFTVKNGGGAAPAAAIACTTGAASLRAVRLLGTGGGTAMRLGLAAGADPSGACELTAQDLTIDGFDGGVRAQRKLTATNLVIRNSKHIGLYLPQATGSDPDVTLTGGEITSSGEAGIAQETGSLAVTGTNVHGNTARGLEVEGDGVATLGPGSKFDANRTGGLRVAGSATVTGTGISASGNTMSSGGLNDGVRVEGGTLTLHQATIDNNEGRGLGMEGGTAVIDDGSLLRNNGRNSGASAIRYKQGNLTLGGATGAVVKISGSARHGLYVWTDSGAGTGSVDIQRTEFSGNDGAGVWVDFLAAGAQGTFVMRASQVFDNVGQGVRVERAPAVGGMPGVLIDGCDIRDNGKTDAQEAPGFSIFAVGDVVATVINNQIHGNRATGVLVEQFSGTASLTLDGNDIYANNVVSDLPVGGVMFGTASTLTSFRANKVHGNQGDEVGFAAPANTGAAWTLGSGACDPGSNQIYCYGAGDVGIRISGATAATVNAAGTAFQSATPALGTDWTVSGGAHVVNAAGACAPVATCP